MALLWILTTHPAQKDHNCMSPSMDTVCDKANSTISDEYATRNSLTKFLVLVYLMCRAAVEKRVQLFSSIPSSIPKLPSFLHNSNCFQTCCIRIDFSAIEVQFPGGINSEYTSE
ncbi:hypothetical protein T08_8361 [Trichinella sp. T8]|nr:hypothetical protein T08_8361 [Trichinella sp. T8]